MFTWKLLVRVESLSFVERFEARTGGAVEAWTGDRSVPSGLVINQADSPQSALKAHHHPCSPHHQSPTHTSSDSLVVSLGQDAIKAVRRGR